MLDHHNIVENFGHFDVSARMAGAKVLGRGAWMQVGSALLYGVKVEAGEVLLHGTGSECKQVG